MGRPFKFSGRRDYFAVNNKPGGYSTSFRVSGRLGELARRFVNFADANTEAKRLNRAYAMGYRAGLEYQNTAPAEWVEAAVDGYSERFKP